MNEPLMRKRTHSQLKILLAAKEQREGVQIALKPLAKHLDISPYTLYALYHDTLDRFPRDMIEKLCASSIVRQATL